MLVFILFFFLILRKRVIPGERKEALLRINSRPAQNIFLYEMKGNTDRHPHHFQNISLLDGKNEAQFVLISLRDRLYGIKQFTSNQFRLYSVASMVSYRMRKGLMCQLYIRTFIEIISIDEQTKGGVLNKLKIQYRWSIDAFTVMTAEKLCFYLIILYLARNIW